MQTNCASLAQLLFARCAVKKVDVCKIMPLSPPRCTGTKKTACVRYAGGERMHHRAQLAQELPQSRIRSTAPSKREPYGGAVNFAATEKASLIEGGGTP